MDDEHAAKVPKREISCLRCNKDLTEDTNRRDYSQNKKSWAPFCYLLECTKMTPAGGRCAADVMKTPSNYSI